MELKDKLNLTFKFLFLAVFAYGVITLTCCKDDCSKSSCTQSSCQTAKCSAGNQIKKTCGSGCVKPCCDMNAKKTCGTDCTKPCCKK